MPLKKCSSGKMSGYKWGDSGHCYTGPDAKRQAIKQGLAIDGPEKFKKEVSKAELIILKNDPLLDSKTRKQINKLIEELND